MKWLFGAPFAELYWYRERYTQYIAKKMADVIGIRGGGHSLVNYIHSPPPDYLSQGRHNNNSKVFSIQQLTMPEIGGNRSTKKLLDKLAGKILYSADDTRYHSITVFECSKNLGGCDAICLWWTPKGEGAISHCPENILILQHKSQACHGCSGSNAMDMSVFL